jgi:hypothetical protein
MPKTGWQVFAANNNLKFKFEIPLLRAAHVVGNFGRYQVRLETFPRSRQLSTVGYASATIHTRMILRASKPLAAIAPDKAFDKSKIFDLLIPKTAQQGIKGRFYAYETGREIVYEQKTVEANPHYLQTVLALLKGLIESYPRVLALGAEAVSVLHPVSKSYHLLQHVVGQLIFDIGQETEQTLKKQASGLLCPHCLVHCGPHQVQVPWIGDITYYGCRACSQSRNLVNSGKYRLVICLDKDLPIEQTTRGGIIRKNWLKHPRLFDFEEVEIVKASDEEVERFAVQVGNDTDPIRSPQYKQMRCSISTACSLSENTMRVLRGMFWQVEIK